MTTMSDFIRRHFAPPLRPHGNTPSCPLYDLFLKFHRAVYRRSLDCRSDQVSLELRISQPQGMPIHCATIPDCPRRARKLGALFSPPVAGLGLLDHRSSARDIQWAH